MNGIEVQSAWPRARGKKLHPKTKAQMEYFRQVQWAYKFSDANVQTSFRNAVRGTPLMPRDLFLMAVSGRMHRVIDDKGRSWWSVAAIQNISDSLDVVAQLQGQMLIRRADRWGPLPVGTAGQVLTWNVTTGLPEWADAGSGGTAAWGSITGSLSAQADLEAALTAASASGAWGNIGGSISDQSDLVAALLSVGATAEWGQISGSITDQADLEAALGTISASVSAAAETATWGNIGGSIADQADLEAAIATAAAKPWGSITGTLSDQSDLEAALNARWMLTGDNAAVGNQTITGYVAATEARTSLLKMGSVGNIRGDDVLIQSADGSTVYAEFNAAGGVINAGGAPVINITNTYVDYNIEIRRGGNRLWSRFIADPTGFPIHLYDRIVTRPRVANFTWVNQGGTGASGTTATDVNNGILVENISPYAGSNIRYLKTNTTVPSTFTVTMRGINQSPITGGSYPMALVLRNSTSGRILIFGDFSSNVQSLVQQWSSFTVFNNNIIAQTGIAPTSFPWRRITFDGTTIRFQVSNDGNQFYDFITTTSAAYINAAGGSIDEVGIGLMTNGGKVATVFQHFDIVP